jgi:DNA repair protein RadC
MLINLKKGFKVNNLYNNILKTTKKLVSNINIETFFCIKLDSSDNILDIFITTGTQDKVYINYNTLFRWLMTGKKYYQFIITHNHPNGVLKSSQGDRNVVQHILKLQWMLKQNIMKDSLIFDYSNNKYFSFEEDGLHSLLWTDLCDKLDMINNISF